MTEEASALFRAELFERAAKAILGLRVDPPAKPGEAAASTAAPEPVEHDASTEGGGDVE